MAIKASIAPLADEAESRTMDVITPDPVAAPRQTADMIDADVAAIHPVLDDIVVRPVEAALPVLPPSIVIVGGPGNDTILGSAGDDAIGGGAGNDQIEGGKSRDTLTGGEGRDFFVAGLNGDAWHSHHYRPDIITDFTAPGTVRDCIDLRVIMAKTTFNGTTVQQAVDQGYLSLLEYQNIDGSFGTAVVIDRTGSTVADPHTMGPIAVLDLQNVHANQLGFSTFASHFML